MSFITKTSPFSRISRAACAAALLLAGAQGVVATELDSLLATAEMLCGNADRDAEAMADAIGGRVIDEEFRGPADAPMRLERRFGVAPLGEIHLVIDRPGGALRRMILEHHGLGDAGVRPSSMFLLSGDCRMQHARQIIYDEGGHAGELRLFGPGLVPLSEPEQLNPPMPEQPAGGAEDGVIVALFDSGLAYTLPEVSARLAHGPDGQAFGYDFWDMDDRPFDADTGRSPFFPMRHGTVVASVLLREAPDVRVAPFRYPRPDMSRMAQMVEAAAEAGARVVSMPMGSNRSEDWEAFAEAAKARSELLFVLSAGNDGRNLDREPLWPAALGLENAVVVTSAEESGELAAGSNWGAGTVDLMVPAENVSVFDYRGVTGRASGTSYAVPRVAALAARILQADPALSTTELKAAVVERASAPPGNAGELVRHGWIADPTIDE